MFPRLLVALLLFEASALAQSGSISGWIGGLDGAVAADVRIAVREVPAPNATSKESALAGISQTDGNGRYRLEDIPPGRYYITAGPVDFPTYYPSVVSMTDAKIVEVRAGAVLTDLNFNLANRQSGRIYGMIRGLDGALAAGVRVAVKEVPAPNATSKESALVRFDQTDGNGRYRLEDIPPGRYYITAGSVDLPTYYPSVGSIRDAKIVEVRAGAVLELYFNLANAGSRVSGRVNGLPQDMLADLRVVLMLANPPNGPLKFRYTIIKPNGSFEFPSISNGRYALRVMRARTADTIDFPYMPVVSTFDVIDEDVQGLELEIKPEAVR